MSTTPMGPRGQKKSYWKQVLIGGTPGILLGAAAAFGADTLTAADEITSPDSEELLADAELCATSATTVTDDMSFAEAFRSARAEMGPGGTFVWHGNVYGTYYADEWNAMTPEQQHDFAVEAGVSGPTTGGHHEDTPVTDPTAPHVPDDIAATGGHDTNGGNGANNTGSTNGGNGANDTNGGETNEIAQNNADDTVQPAEHVAIIEEDEPVEVPVDEPVTPDEPAAPQLAATPLGVQTLTAPDGSEYTVGLVQYGDQLAYMIDADNDGVFDGITCDINGNGVIDDDELQIIADQHITIDDFYAWLDNPSAAPANDFAMRAAEVDAAVTEDFTPADAELPSDDYSGDDLAANDDILI